MSSAVRQTTQQRAHALLSPSASGRWIECSPCAKMEEKYKDEENNSMYAQEGTVAHAVGCRLIEDALHLNEKNSRCEWLRLTEDKLYDEQMLMYASQYRDFVVERFNACKAKTIDTKLILEQELDLTDWIPEGWGSADCVIIADGVMEVIDLKYGQGVRVEAEGNTQLRCYALGALAENGYLYDIKEVVMSIYQPRKENYSSCVMRTEELLLWGDEVLRVQAQKAYKGEGEYKAGEHCRFCKARNHCKRYAEFCLEITEPQMKEADELSEQEVESILARAETIKKWLSGIEEYALSQALKGRKWAGFKLVEGRSNRICSDCESVAKALSQAGIDPALIYVKSLKTITTLEKEIGKKAFAEIAGQWIVKPQGKPTLVPQSDKREEMNTAENDFKDIVINE